MIDTVVLTLNQDEFSIFAHDKFGPSTALLYNNAFRLGNRSNLVCIQNPTTSELREGIYKPRLSVTKRINRNGKFEIALKIEFSASKLLFGNNFEELDDIDFYPLIVKLGQQLEGMGVIVSLTILSHAQVSSIHYSKNIPLTDYTTPYTYIERLSKINLNKRLDLNQTDFRNGGHSLKFRANSFELAFYDKIMDLYKAKMSEKRTEEKQNLIQVKLLDIFKELKPFEVLRMELRLNRRQKLRQILKQVGIPVEPLFCNLFKREIAQKVLLYYLDYFKQDYSVIIQDYSREPERLFSDLLLNNPGIRLNKALQVLGTLILIDSLGIRKLREIASRYGDTSWYRLNKEMKSLNYSQHEDDLRPIRYCLQEFRPLKLIDYLK